MNTVFPVEFEVVSENGEKSPSGLLQGFTRDISAGGMCIEFKTFGKKTEKILALSGAVLSLTINPTFSIHPIKASAKIVWLKKEDSLHPPRYFIGVTYEQIDPMAQKRLIGHAHRSIWAPRAAALAGLFLVCLLGGLFVHDQQLINENRALVRKVTLTAEKKSQVTQDLQDLDARKKMLGAELRAAREKIEKLEASLSSMKQENQTLGEQRVVLATQLHESADKQQAIRRQLEDIQTGQKKLQETYRRLEQEGQKQSSAVSDQMFQWLKSHQNARTGLVASFEGDPSLEDAGFTYDQSLAAQVFLLFGDQKDAAAILSFFDQHAATEGGAFFNVYETMAGSPTESMIHVGPNVWLGIAALQYQHQNKDGAFLPLAKKIADWMIRFQDEEGGLPGGPKVQWYSTEHNLDAYAFFRMMHEETGDAKYSSAAQRSLQWIQKYAYSVREMRPNRGKGDATIATDTFSWSIAAIGPQKLKEIQLDPEAIMEFAEKHCEVTAQAHLPHNISVSVRGFDFSKAQNLGRGGVVSTEWTAQMIVSYQVLAHYFEELGESEKAISYSQKANLYLSELQKLIITSPSRTGQGRGCLPYASVDNVDTGHGWRTPKGASTGSVAATAYGLFAWKGYNPFELDRSKTESNPTV